MESGNKGGKSFNTKNHRVDFAVQVGIGFTLFQVNVRCRFMNLDASNRNADLSFYI
jgi:hypothetical protein